jgi:cytochrome P450
MTPRPRKYDLYSDAFRADTYATFARMRDEDPVLCQPGVDGETPIWFVTRYDDAEAVLLDDERFVRDPRPTASGSGSGPSQWSARRSRRPRWSRPTRC